MHSDSYPEKALDAVHEGMHVIDAKGDDIGDVTEVIHPDPDMASTVHNEQAIRRHRPVHPPLPGPGLAGGVLTPPGAADMTAIPIGPSEPAVPPELAERLLQTGYVKIDCKGLFRRDRYAGADQISDVEGETMYLAVPKKELAR